MDNSLSTMMCLDIYLSNLDTQNSTKVKNQLESLITESKPLLSWDIATTHYCQKTTIGKMILIKYLSIMTLKRLFLLTH